MIFRSILGIVFLLSLVSSASAGYYEECYFESGDMVSVSVSGQVVKGVKTGVFSYDYAVGSKSASQQDIWLFKIILPERDIVINSGAPLGWKIPGWARKFAKYSSSIERKPPHWIAWTAFDEKDLRPSEIVSGFVFETSFGLPGIVDYYAEGESIAWCPEGMAVDFIPGYHDLTPYGPGIVGKTIGPVSPPADLKPSDFLDYIIDLKHQSVSLGWIKNKGVVTSLDAKLDNAKKKIAQGNSEAAKNVLDAFINEVEGQGCKTYQNCSKGKHLTSEAYSLLKYNAQYLLDKLSKQ